MEAQTFDGHSGRQLAVDLCHACQAFWFDAHESLSLTPGSTLALFRVIGDRTARPASPASGALRCPRCRARLKRVHDRQRAMRFEYVACPEGHGRFTTFFNFLREKDFIRPLTPQQIAELRNAVQTVNCSNCGGPIDLQAGAVCAHCGSPVSMLDLRQAERLVQQLQRAEDRAGRPVDPALPLELARARRDVEAAFAAFERDDAWFRDVSSAGLVGAGLRALARWLERG
jgi:hypothetical protein